MFCKKIMICMATLLLLFSVGVSATIVEGALSDGTSAAALFHYADARLVPQVSRLGDGTQTVWLDKQSSVLRTRAALKGIYGAGNTKDNSSRTDSSATLILAGDIMCLSAQQGVAKAGDSYNFEYAFEELKPVFDRADLVVGNLETLISKSNPITSVQKNAADGSPQCNAPSALLPVLKRVGFDVLITANNHCCDWGPTGITETLEMLDLFGFAHVGTSYMPKRSEEATASDSFLMTEINGIRIAFIASTHLVNQRDYMTEDEMSAMVACFDRERTAGAIAAAREAGAEYVINYAHWGRENTEDITPEQRADAAFMAEAGADMVIGSHPHCLQGKDTVITTDGRSVPVFYSVGNLVSSMVRDINNDAALIQLELKKDAATGAVTAAGLDYIPFYVSMNDFSLHRLTVERASGGAQRERLDRINRLLGSDLE